MLKRFIPESGYLRNILTLMTGTSLSQALVISISPILTRLYTPEDFGVFALYGSLIGILGVIANGRYELAIMIPEKDEDAKGVLYLSILIAFFVSAILFLLVWLFNDHFTAWLKEPEISIWLYFVPLSVLFFGIYNSLNYWFNRKEKYKEMAINRVVQTSTNAGVNLSLGALTQGPLGLIGGQVSGQFLAAFIFAFRFLKNPSFMNLKRASMKRVLKNYADFPMKSSFGIAFNLLANQLPVIFIGILYGSGILGFYALIMRILNAPLSVIGKAVSQVFFQTASQNMREKKNNISLFQKTSIQLFAIIVIPMVVLFFFGSDLFAFVFGEEWREAGELVRLFVFYYMIRFVFSAQSTLLIIRRNLGTEAIFNAVLFVTQMGSLYFGYITGGYYHSFLYMAISGFVMYIVLGIILFKLARAK